MILYCYDYFHIIPAFSELLLQFFLYFLPSLIPPSLSM